MKWFRATSNVNLTITFPFVLISPIFIVLVLFALHPQYYGETDMLFGRSLVIYKMLRSCKDYIYTRTNMLQCYVIGTYLETYDAY